MQSVNLIYIWYASVTVCIFNWKYVSADDAAQPAETTTIRTEDGNLKAAGPFLIDAKIKDGEMPKTTAVGAWQIIHKSLTWGEAVAACENITKGQLAVLPKKADAEELAAAIVGISKGKDIIENPENWKKKEEMDLGISRRYWIGLTDQIEEGKWMWINIGYNLTYDDFWYPGQPSHNPSPGGDPPKTSGEHCGSLWNPGYYADTENTHKFNDAPCTEAYYPICDPRAANEIKDKLIPKEED